MKHLINVMIIGFIFVKNVEAGIIREINLEKINSVEVLLAPKGCKVTRFIRRNAHTIRVIRHLDCYGLILNVVQGYDTNKRLDTTIEKVLLFPVSRSFSHTQWLKEILNTHLVTNTKSNDVNVTKSLVSYNLELSKLSDYSKVDQDEFVNLGRLEYSYELFSDPKQRTNLKYGQLK